MTGMRITQKAISQTALQGLNRNLTELGKLQEQLTSGKVVSRPSDSPTAVNRSMQIRKDQAATAQHARNISDAQSWMETTDTALTSMVAQVRRVRDLTVQAANDGAMTTEARTAISAEVAALRDSLLGLANENVDGRPVFGGATSGTKAYEADGTWVGVGSADGTGVVPIKRRISNDEQVRIDTTGPEAFGPPGSDLFTVVGKIAADVGAGVSVQDDLTDLDAAIDRLLTAASTVGARAARVDNAAQVNTDRSLALKKQLTNVEDVDLPKTIMQLQFQQTGYQAALQATAQVIQPSLADFLR
ncbi:flagellar hook-associated protein FlgL [Geodermatophilus aquaeductus]|uniref:Flagellar hook-associated protein 3 FlgL n=2 Tax=Geodermatophilus aquaeductus TaxID=1564161 RepID=A0A521CI91_9ACTN|nr:flagellar hook-associated protein 3 FlgL [Geodermatophilus aquaeductus]